jgi:hypothetical protein
MLKRPIPVFLLCFAVVALSGAAALVVTAGNLQPPDQTWLMPALPSLRLIAAVALLEAPILAVASARRGVARAWLAGYAGTVVGFAAAMATLSAVVDNLVQQVGSGPADFIRSAIPITALYALPVGLVFVLAWALAAPAELRMIGRRGRQAARNQAIWRHRTRDHRHVTGRRPDDARKEHR